MVLEVNSMKKIIFGVIIMSLILLSGCSQQNSRVAVFSGWLFEIKTTDGIHKYLIRDDTSLNGELKVLNESEIITQARSQAFPQPMQIWTLQEWTTKCNQQMQNARQCNQEEYQQDKSVCTGNNDTKICSESFEDWSIECEQGNARLNCTTQLLPYDKFKSFMEDYMTKNGINGDIANSYVAMFPIYGVDLLNISGRNSVNQ